MLEEKEELNENSEELSRNSENEIEDEDKKDAREVWLLLIFLNLIVLCTLGFFIYNLFKKLPEKADFKKAEIVETVDEPRAGTTESHVKKEKPAPQSPAAPDKDDLRAQTAKQTSYVPSVSAEKRRSVSVRGNGSHTTRDVTFKYYDTAKSVAVVGGFTGRKPMPMSKTNKTGDEWNLTLRVRPGENYPYMFVVDGREILDPNGRTADGKSVFTVK
jgi:hypothetical protein